MPAPKLPSGKAVLERKAKEGDGKAGMVVEKIPDTCVPEARGVDSRSLQVRCPVGPLVLHLVEGVHPAQPLGSGVREGPAGEGKAQGSSCSSWKFLTLVRDGANQPPARHHHKDPARGWPCFVYTPPISSWGYFKPVPDVILLYP